ncbi:RICIN domain-containing protein [Nonomuraea fuscirosea]|uniref:RICIN domain-containing protein n=1 Tax=Nonomuraea fuscirosea TaxID=1291556 RepID=UPI0033F63FFA
MNSINHREPRTDRPHVRRAVRLAAMLTLISSLVVSTGGSALASEASPSAREMAVGSRLVNGDGDTSGKCLENAGGRGGPSLQMAPCHTNAHQSWYFHQLGSGYVQIRSHDVDAADKCITSYGHGDPVRMEFCDGGDHQRWWTGRQASPGWMQLSASNPGFSVCLDVKEHGESNIVQAWECGASNQGNQLWKWHSVG